MTASRRPLLPFNSRREVAAPQSTWNTGGAEIKGTDFLFGLYLVLVFAEYGGLTSIFPPLKLIRFTTVLNYAIILSLLAKAPVGQVFSTVHGKLLLGFFFMTGLGVLYAEVQTNAFNLIRPFLELISFMTMTALLLDRPARLKKFAIVCAAVAVMLVALNVNKLGSSVRAGAFMAPYFMGDGNDLAWGLIVLLPFGAALMTAWPGWKTRLLGMAAICAALIGIVGTQSRGGTIGLAAAMLYGWWFVSKRRAVGATAVVCAGLVVILVAPAGYFQRMQSVSEYEEDNSAQARLQAWGMAIRMANDYPLGVGAGNFNSAYGRHYNDINTSRIQWAAGRWLSPHSIYFKVLGELGWIGAAMLLWLMGATIATNVRTRRQLKDRDVGAPLDVRWPSFVNMSVLGFAVAGIFLSGFHYPHLFLVVGLTLSAHRIVTLESAATAPVVAGTPGALRKVVPPVTAAAARRPVRPGFAATPVMRTRRP